jgi:hypothetical protein
MRTEVKDVLTKAVLGDELLGQDHRRFLKTLLEYRGVDKLRGTYCQGILDKLSPDGRLRPNWNIAGTVTGRFSCEAPAINTRPHEGSGEPLTVSNGGRPMPHAPASRPRASASVLASSSTRTPPAGRPAAVRVAGAYGCAHSPSVRRDLGH